MTSTLSLGIDAERIALLPAAIKADIEANKFDGAVVLVARRGDIILHEAVGYADRAANKPARRDSVFITMSIFKQMDRRIRRAGGHRGPRLWQRGR